MINANEQRVIDAASGTFEYEGKIYKAKGDYIGQLTAKMDKEGVDLSAADASAAIQQIMANVGTGVKQGYLEEVGGAQDDEDESSEKSGDGSENKTGDGSGDKKGDSSGGHEGDASGKDTSEGDARETEGGSDGKTSDGSENDRAGETGTDETAAPGTVDVTQIYPEEAEKVELVQKFTDNAGAAQQTVQSFGRYATVTVAVWVLFLIGTAVFLKKIKHRKKMAGAMVGIVIIGVAVLSIGFGYLFGREIYSGARWGQVVTESGYLKESYNHVNSVMQECLERAGLPGETLGSCMDENSVYRDAKTLVAGSEGAKQAVLEKKNAAVREAVAVAAPGLPEEQLTRMAQILVQKYQDGLEIPWLAYLEENQETGRMRTGICFLAGVLAAAAGILILKMKTRYAHRAVRGVFLGCLAGGAGFALSGLVYRFVEFPLAMEPENYERLIENYVHSVCQSGVYFGILTVCAALSFAIVSYFMKTRIE